METKFNFKSAICTSREQSERLLALGLKKETADLQLVCSDSFKDGVLILPYPPDEKGDIPAIPAWSLHRLLMMVTTKRKCLLIKCENDLFDVVIDRIEYAIKEGYFNKEYLI